MGNDPEIVQSRNRRGIARQGVSVACCGRLLLVAGIKYIAKADMQPRVSRMQFERIQIYVVRLLQQSAALAPDIAGADSIQSGIDELRPSLDLIIHYSYQQGLIPRRFAVEELFNM